MNDFQQSLSSGKLRIVYVFSQRCAWRGLRNVEEKDMQSHDLWDNAVRALLVADDDLDYSRRQLLFAPLLASLPLALTGRAARAGTIDPAETMIIQPSAIHWGSWIEGFPPHSGQMATLYGGLDQPGPYLVLMKWYPGYMSAPHTYATDRLSLVLSGTWWVNSGSDFDPDNTVPVQAGGFVRRVAHTPHYDGVPKDATDPAVIGIFGMAPVQFQLVDSSKPGWRRV